MRRGDAGLRGGGRRGRPLPANDGPFELVALDDRGGTRARRAKYNALRFRMSRWIRDLPELESIKVGATRGELLKVLREEAWLSSSKTLLTPAGETG